jgi:hypothetical protein
MQLDKRLTYIRLEFAGGQQAASKYSHQDGEESGHMVPGTVFSQGCVGV